VAIRELSELNQSLQTSHRPRPVVEARAS
jgi:hypothetical protein